MTTINDVVKVNLLTPPPELTVGDFSTPAIFTTNAPVDPSFTGIMRQYTGDTGLTDVGYDFGTGSDTYKAVQSLLAQPNKPAKFYIVNRATPSAQTHTLTFDKDMTANCRIVGTVNGTAITPVEFYTDQESTMALLETELEAIDGIDSVTISSTPFRVATIVAESEYNLDIALEVVGISNPPTITHALTVAGSTILDDLNDFLEETEAWYVALTVQKSDGIIDSLSRSIQAIGKDFVYSNGSSDVANAVANNIQARISGRSLSTLYIWHGIATEYADFAFVGKMYGSYAPYVAQAAHKDLKNVTPSPKTGTGALSTTQETNVKNQKGNVYRSVSGASITFTGIRSDGTFWDTKRDLDYFKNQLQINVFQVFLANPKISFTDKGLAKIGAVILATGKSAEIDPITEIGLFDTGSVNVFVPTRADFTANEIASRVASKFRLTGTLAGALIAIELDVVTSN